MIVAIKKAPVKIIKNKIKNILSHERTANFKLNVDKSQAQ
ncbi:hypothetical protein COI_1635 [Mannheimia haemolytica serotype A2 str. OVINE]|nr:hypothetical protein COI_1635 [Mannheimia haemolytica serotype A2 str. OVINE]EEY12803.1 hypothetical protein COK_1103 [Mannheimia haemolytica serotype A2 str. BOVINE]